MVIQDKVIVIISETPDKQEQCDQQNQSSDCSPILSAGEASLQILCSVLGPSLQGHWDAGAWPEKGNGADKGPGT